MVRSFFDRTSSQNRGTVDGHACGRALRSPTAGNFRAPVWVVLEGPTRDGACTSTPRPTRDGGRTTRTGTKACAGPRSCCWPTVTGGLGRPLQRCRQAASGLGSGVEAWPVPTVRRCRLRRHGGAARCGRRGLGGRVLVAFRGRGRAGAGRSAPPTAGGCSAPCPAIPTGTTAAPVHWTALFQPARTVSIGDAGDHPRPMPRNPASAFVGGPAATNRGPLPRAH